MRRHAVACGALLWVLVLSGCITDGEDLGTDPNGTSHEQAGAHAVVALVDTGINPYHEAFRDHSGLAYTHPSKYLPGYPEDAKRLDLSLNETDLVAAEEADLEVWQGVEPHTLYWIPGTKIVAAYTTTQSGEIFDTGHGTMVASRAAGNQYSLCPECRIAAVQGFNAESVSWAAEQNWIDAQSNSWSPYVVLQQADPAQSPGLAQAFEEAATKQLVFGSAGNGINGKEGVLGHPSFTRSTSGPPGVIAVGGHDNGDVVLWSGSVPHMVADACRNMAVIGDTIDEWGPVGGGTSSASPYAAGAAARIILEARVLLGDNGSAEYETGVVAQGNPLESGPLADGQLTMQEVQDLLTRTAQPRPVETEHDGEHCGTDRPERPTYPITWEDIPQDVPVYYFIGWGAVTTHSVQHAFEVLAGQAPMPERADVEDQHMLYQSVRDLYNSLP